MKNGVDIVKIERFEKSKNIDAFLNKHFSSAEQQFVFSKNKSAQTIAGMFAAKEAVLKAIGTGIGAGPSLKEIEILHAQNGEPFVNITPQLNYYLNKCGSSSASISISHDGDYAVAFCIIF